MLKHARYSECRDVSGFKTELADIVNSFREQTIKLGKVSQLLYKIRNVELVSR